jgi:osmotically-inducible protein OsmY
MNSEPRLSTPDIEQRIAEALRREGAEAEHRVWVSSRGARALLHGSVRSTEALRRVKRAAAASPHVRDVLSLIEIGS